MAIRDGFGIARSAVETAVNAAYISVAGRPFAERAVRHMRQKRWRDLHRAGDVGGWRVCVERKIHRTIDEFPDLAAAVNEYTNKRGGEVRDWTPDTVEQRIRLITDRCARAGTCLGAAVFAIYRPSSELLHGTFYGVNLFWQGSRDTSVRGSEQFDDLWINEHFVTLLTAMVLAVSGAIEAIAVVNGMKQHIERQDALSRQLSALIEDMNRAPEAARVATGEGGLDVEDA